MGKLGSKFIWSTEVYQLGSLTIHCAKVMQFAALPTSHKGGAVLCCYKMDFCSLGVFWVDRFQFPCVTDLVRLGKICLSLVPRPLPENEARSVRD